MKHTHSFLSARTVSALAIAFAVSATATPAMAGGTHAGGHGHEVTAIGKPGVAAKVSRTIAVDMADTMRYTPADIQEVLAK